MRQDQRAEHELRKIKVTRGFTQTPAGSVLWEQGKTIVLCTACITAEVPTWFREDRPGGWVTAEYVMLPGSTPVRKGWPKIGHTDSRGTEIQRLIGRSLRAVVDLSKIGAHTISVDCQVLQADGGTRTAAICAGFVALTDAIAKLPREMPVPRGSFREPASERPLPARFDPKFYDPSTALVDQLAAVSVGVVDGQVMLDLDYGEDSRAEVDMNVGYTGRGRFVEVQGSAEKGLGFERQGMEQMLDLAVVGCERIMEIQGQS
jgi:ribonuclease PH